jgi:membrane-bound serine protease (ClpP class)
MVAELFVPGFGLVFVPGLVLFGAGAYLMFRVPEESDLSLPLWRFVVPVVGTFGLLGALVIWGVSRSFARPQFAGTAALIGAHGTADRAIGPDGGSVLLRGELWGARSEQPIDPGASVEVEGLEGLTLRVRPAHPDPERRA